MSFTQEDLNNVGRSLLYHVAFTGLTLGMGLAYLPFLLSKNKKLKADIPYKWTAIALKMQQKLLKLNVKVTCQVSPLPKGGVVYAVKHQSSWETMALWQILDRPVFVLKKELLDIPVFGWYLRQADNIVIDRKSGQKAVGQIIDQSMKYLMEGRNIVIFPEGTRTRPGQTIPYKIGIGALYEVLSPQIYPVALNSGCFWGKNSLIRKAGTVEVEILPPMEKGLEKRAFMQELQNRIEAVTSRLVENPLYPPPSDYY